MRGCRDLLGAALFAALVVGNPETALSVVVAGQYQNSSDATVNITPPSSDPGFYNVGAIATASAIYLGNDWVLTADHVSTAPVTFSFPDRTNSSQLDTATYNIVPNSGVVLTNPTGANAGTASDLILYRIDPTSTPYGEPNLPQLLLSSSSPSVGSTVTAVGYGVDRDSTLTYWDNSQPVWNTTTQNLAAHLGYLTTGPQDLRWGENVVSGASSQIALGTKWVQAYSTTFNSGAGAVSNEFQVTNGDSGGAVFSQIGNTWVLSGMIDGIGLLNGQPYHSTNGNSDTAVFGDTSILADISFYRSQILALNPLPGDANGDGIVNSQDLALISSNWLAVGSGEAGDINGDGIVNSQDLALVSSNWTTATSNAPPTIGTADAHSASVPEPATAVMSLLGGVISWALYFRRRRSR